MKHIIMASAVAALTLGGCKTIRTKPIVQVESTTENIGTAKMAEAIKASLANRGWKVRNQTGNTIRAEVLQREHRATIDVVYDGDSYEIKYVDSENLEYDPEAGRIHRAYNNWITMLDNDIQARLF